MQVIIKMDGRKAHCRIPRGPICNLLIIILSITNFGIRKLMYFENFFGVKTAVAFFKSFENCRRQCEGTR